jgi:hypothetical protein
MKINKLIKRFSLLAISYFCLTATHVAAENFVEVKNESNKWAVVDISINGRDHLASSECLGKESTKFNLDEVGIPVGEKYYVHFKLFWDCEKTASAGGTCTKRKHGEQVKDGKFPKLPQRTTSTGTRKYVIRDSNGKVRCAQK